MAEKVVPMIHVPDVSATVDWYKDIGFTVIDTYGNDSGGLSFAILSFGSSQVMFNQGGRPSTHDRREVDLYVYTDNVDEFYERIKDRVEIVDGLHDTFYGMREFIIRDLNRFWITFGQPTVFDVLMTGVRDGNTELVRSALESGGLSPEKLTVALAAASAGDNVNVEVGEMLKRAGAPPPTDVDGQVLQSYAGKYNNKDGLEFNVTFKDGKLFAGPAGQQPLRLIAVDQTTFRATSIDGSITFNVEADKTRGLALKHGSSTIQLKRVEEA